MKYLILAVFLLNSKIAYSIQSYSAFSTLSSSYSVDQDIIETPNMPPVRSQDSLGICYAFSAWTIFQQFTCTETNSDCKSIDQKNSPSPLFLATLGVSKKYKDKADGPVFIPTEAGGFAINTLNAFKSNGKSYSESCYPFDQFISIHRNEVATADESFKRTREALDKLEEVYNANRNKTEADACMDCINKVLQDEFDLKREPIKIAKAFASESFDKFLFEIFLKDCDQITEAKPNFTISGWPKDGWPKDEPNAYKAAMENIKNNLAQRPMTALVCLNATVPIKECTDSHEVVISGYKKSCTPDKKCRDVIKITNSWGQDWQNENNDGWVDAETFYEHMGKVKNGLGWIVPN